jgi:hypothetical protein
MSTYTENIEHQKFTQLPHQISNGLPLTTYILGGQFCIFLYYLHLQNSYFVLLFYTFSYFIPTFPKILVLLLSYFSTQGCQKACCGKTNQLHTMQKTSSKIWACHNVIDKHSNECGAREPYGCMGSSTE